MLKRKLILGGVIGLAVGLTVFLASCAGEAGPAGAAGQDASATCSQCHDDTTLIVSKKFQWEQSGHGSGTAYERGTSSSCAGCHASEGFTARIAAGLDPDEVENGIPNPSPQNCRTCHDIHTSYTKSDFALTTTGPVTLFVGGETFDMGKGNLCASCHQPRREMEVEDGIVDVSSTHWGPHYGTPSAMLLGTGGGISGSPSAHYTMVEDGCVTCHMGTDNNHTWEPQLSACQSCHAELDTFDRNGVQTEVKAMFEELGELLDAKGLLHDGHPVVGKFSEAEATALWAYRFIEPDGSFGVHNPAYTKALLKTAIETLK